MASRRIFIANIPEDYHELKIKRMCQNAAGQVEKVEMLIEPETGSFRCMAFVTFKTDMSAKRAVENLHKSDVKNSLLLVSLTDEKSR